MAIKPRQSWTVILLARVSLVIALVIAQVVFGADPRNIRNGHKIPSEPGYVDQPYVVITKDGNWLCTMTTGKGREGQVGQHIVATISRDQGRTWSDLVDIEPADGPEASWVTPFVAPSGRVYGFYTYNGDMIRTSGTKQIRADTLGWYAFKYSDDNGRSWSKRFRVPMRVTACDRANDWQGKVQIFWGIDKPKVVGGSVMFAFTKLGKYMLENGEGWAYRSDNLLTEQDAARVTWELLPDGDHGIRAPEFGSVQEEHNFVPLSDGQLYCVYRTTTGRPCHAYSSDGGRTWTKPEIMTYTPGGKKVRTPRACPRIWRTSNGKFLFWFHNNGNLGYNGDKSVSSRNIAWLSGGIEKNGKMHWAQPEIVLFEENSLRGPSYPDLIEQNGRYWLTETEKTAARVHEIDAQMLEGLWNQTTNRSVATEGLALSLDASELRPADLRERSGKAKMPRLPNLASGGGFTIEIWLTLENLAAGQVVLDSRDDQGRGIALTTADKASLRLDMGDGRHKASWDCDPDLLTSDKLHHVVFIVDGGPKVISVVVDGVLCDGGENPKRPYGYGRFKMAQYASRLSDQIKKPVDEIGDVSGSDVLRVAPTLKGQLKRLRIYNRYLRTSEAIGNFNAGPTQ